MLISQNRAAALADMRADLDLQIDLLAEYEITRVLRLMTAIGKKLEVGESGEAELDELGQPVPIDEVIREIQLRSIEG